MNIKQRDIVRATQQFTKMLNTGRWSRATVIAFLVSDYTDLALARSLEGDSYGSKRAMAIANYIRTNFGSEETR